MTSQLRRGPRFWARNGARLTALGGLLVAAGFFLPPTSCIESPLRQITGEIFGMNKVEEQITGYQPDSAKSWEGDTANGLLVAYVLLVAPFIFGLAACIAAIIRLRWEHNSAVWNIALGAIYVSAMLALIHLQGMEISRVARVPSLGVLALWLIYLVVGVSRLVVMHPNSARAGALLTANAMLSLAMMLNWVGMEGFPWLNTGFYVCCAGALMMLIGSAAELAARCAPSAHQTIGGIPFIHVLRPRRTNPGHCMNCDYPLFGLTTPRCPECGAAGEIPISPPIDLIPNER